MIHRHQVRQIAEAEFQAGCQWLIAEHLRDSVILHLLTRPSCCHKVNMILQECPHLLSRMQAQWYSPPVPAVVEG